MKRILLTTVLLALAALRTGSSADDPRKHNWTHIVRIGAWGLQPGNAERIVREAEDSHVFGIEVDNDIPGRYESFLDPAEKLKAIHDLAVAAHRHGNRAFVYIAGTECITANADKTPHTMAKDHPDWLQQKITGEPAVFGGGTAFWIRKGDEDVWISPYATEWRKIYMERVRQIAATGIDGIYVDIPYWMTHFEGWEDTWASFDEYTVAAFMKQTGLDATKDLKLGLFSDPNFRKWIEFRIETFTDFMAEIDQTAKSVNPEIKTIPEIYPGIEKEAVRVGADVYGQQALALRFAGGGQTIMHPLDDAGLPTSVADREVLDRVSDGIKAYLNAMWALYTGRYAQHGEAFPEHVRAPCTVFTVLCSDGLIVRYDCVPADERLPV